MNPFWWHDLKQRAHEWVEDRLPMPLKRVWCALGFWTPIDVLRYASEREAAALEREDAASRSAMPPEELAEEPASIVALSRLADQAAAHGWDEAAGHLRTAARSLSSAHCNLQTCSEALAECNVRPSNIKWASDAASAIRALIHKEPANG